MSSSKAVPVIPGINETSSATEMISMLRSSFQQQFDEVERLLIARERNDLRRDLETAGKKPRDTEQKQLTMEKGLKKEEKRLKIQRDNFLEVIRKMNEEIENFKLGRNQAVQKLSETELLVMLLYSILRSEGILISKLEEVYTDFSGADIVDLMQGIRYKDIRDEVEKICKMRYRRSAAMRSSAKGVTCDDAVVNSVFEGKRDSDGKEDVHNGIDSSQLESDNAHFGFENLQGGSDNNLEKTPSEPFYHFL